MLTEAQLAMRGNGVGGSEIAALLGLNPFMSALDLYLLKTGGGEFQGNHHTERGDFLEDGIAEWWAYRNQVSLKSVNRSGTLQHSEYPHVFATPDRLVHTGEGIVVLQIKAPSYFSGKSKWSYGPPAQYVAQVQYEAGVLNSLLSEDEWISRCEVTAVVCDDLKCFPFEFEPDVAEEMFQLAQSFFQNHVIPRIPPEKK